MSLPCTSRTVISVSPSLADVLAEVSAADLPERRRQDLASAVRAAARAIGRRPEQIPADPRMLASRLAEVAPQSLGFSKPRWNNVRSLLRAALELVTPVSPGRHLTPLSPAWQTLWNRLPTRRLKNRLSRLMHFCSAAGIEPEEMAEASFVAFREHLELTLLKSPPIVLRETVLGWNKARAQVPGWPDLPVTVPDRRTVWTLPWSAFPESLRTDVARYLDRLGGGDPLDELPFRPVRPGTLQHREYQIRQFASALVRRGWDPASLRSIADLLSLDAFKEGLRYLLERRGGKSTSTVSILAGCLKAIARHYVQVDEQQLARMSAVARRLEAPQRTLTEKNRSRLRPLEDPDNALALARLPGALMQLAQREHRTKRAARLAQTAVAIELLLMAPMRIGNLASIDVERHLIRPSRTGQLLHIVFASGEVKNREPLEYPLPPESVALLETYLSRFRPALAPSGNTALFPGQGRTRKHVATLREQIGKAVFTHTGLRVNPHLFRHVGAKLFLDRNPGSYEVMRRVLGHRSLQTTVSFYSGCETVSAVRHFDAEILKLRQGGGVR